jgi:radical SAM protein with 4Fe4S-binding SPASM domain
MQNLICKPHCSFFKPGKAEGEKCLPYEWLTAWAHQDARIREMLASLASGGDSLAEASPRLRPVLCGRCPFRAHGCDFAAASEAQDTPPCGGFKVLAELLAQGRLTAGELMAAWDRFLDAGYLRLAEHASLRRLEEPYVYDRLADELYEVNDQGFAWLCRCDGTTRGLAREADPEFLAYLLEHSLVAPAAAPCPRVFHLRQSPLPSLRYLEMLLTNRCNLRCRHCYLEAGGFTDLFLPMVFRGLQEFEEMQGLRVLLSGGEPLLYRWWDELNRRLPEFELRFVLLTNGTLITPEVARGLKVQEVQVSLDGLQAGHESLRGPGTFEAAWAGLLAAKEAGLEVSCATMIHAGNIQELEELGERLREVGVREWNLDVPCLSGRLTAHRDLYLPPAAAAPFLSLGFGGAAHGADENFACGRHLAAVLPDGRVAKCGLFAHEPLGRLAEGLETCWQRLHHIPLEKLECAGCKHLHECRGGCRFRAGQGLGPDPVMCALYGVGKDR